MVFPTTGLPDSLQSNQISQGGSIEACKASYSFEAILSWYWLFFFFPPNHEPQSFSAGCSCFDNRHNGISVPSFWVFNQCAEPFWPHSGAIGIVVDDAIVVAENAG